MHKLCTSYQHYFNTVINKLSTGLGGDISFKNTLKTQDKTLNLAIGIDQVRTQLFAVLHRSFRSHFLSVCKRE